MTKCKLYRFEKIFPAAWSTSCISWSSALLPPWGFLDWLNFCRHMVVGRQPQRWEIASSTAMLAYMWYRIHWCMIPWHILHATDIQWYRIDQINYSFAAVPAITPYRKLSRVTSRIRIEIPNIHKLSCRAVSLYCLLYPNNAAGKISNGTFQSFIFES